jgi:hypothetical protein
MVAASRRDAGYRCRDRRCVGPDALPPDSGAHGGRTMSGSPYRGAAPVALPGHPSSRTAIELLCSRCRTALRRGPQIPPGPTSGPPGAPTGALLVGMVLVGRFHWRLASRTAPPSAVLLRNATPSVLHQRHIGRVLRSSCNPRGRRLASSRGREPQPGRCPSLWPGDLRNDGISVAAVGVDGSET